MNVEQLNDISNISPQLKAAAAIAYALVWAIIFHIAS